MPLRRRLVLLAAGTVAITVVLASVVCYVAMRAELRGQIDETLVGQGRLVQRVSERLGGPPPAGDAPAPPAPGEAAGFIQLLGGAGDVRSGSDQDLRIPVTPPIAASPPVTGAGRSMIARCKAASCGSSPSLCPAAPAPSSSPAASRAPTPRSASFGSSWRCCACWAPLSRWPSAASSAAGSSHPSPS